MNNDAKKRLLRMIHYGMFVMTARKQEDIVAGTVTWMSQCSFEPPLLMVAVKKSSGMFRVVKDVRRFAVHVLGDDQREEAAMFFRVSQIEDRTINGIPFTDGVTGAPILEGMPAYVECEVTDVVERGDHAVVVAEIVEAEVSGEKPALALRDTGWYYGG